jgi:CO/xanthine dehydrogenase Mo-binding subunit
MSGASNIPYGIPNIRVEYTPVSSVVPRSWWRSVANSFNAFVRECFLDELAHELHRDPLQFRRELLREARMIRDTVDTSMVLSSERLLRVVEAAANQAQWNNPLPRGRARGIACDFAFGTYTAHVAEVSLNSTGFPQVHRVVAAFDCGQVINPNGARAQAEGGIGYALSAALKSKIDIDRSSVLQTNFDDYELLRFPEMPQVETVFVESSEPPKGLGEPVVPSVAPAVANALFSLTGKRVRRLPIASHFA